MIFTTLEYKGDTPIITAVTTNRVMMEPEGVQYLKSNGRWYLMTADPVGKHDRVGPVAAAKLDAWRDERDSTARAQFARQLRRGNGTCSRPTARSTCPVRHICTITGCR